VVLARAQRRLVAFVANEDDGAIHTVDLEKRREVAVTPLDGTPSNLVALRDGRLVAALRDRNEIVILEPRPDANGQLDVLCKATVASEPLGLATLAPRKHDSEERVVVTSGFGHALTVLGTNELTVQRAVDLPRDPRAVLTRGERIFVSYAASAVVSVVDPETGTAAPIDLLGGQKPEGQSFARTSAVSEAKTPLRGAQGFSLSTDGAGRIFAPMVVVDPGEPKITGGGYGGSAERPVKPFVGVIDVASNKRLPSAAPTSVTQSRECVLPRASAATKDGKLFVACLGNDEVLELDARTDNAAQVIKRRVRVAAGPVGMALAGDDLVVWSQFDREVAIVSADGTSTDAVRIPVSRPELDAKLERGRKLFHDTFDPRVSSDGRACASCHPDGRDDGNTWSTPDGPRQTITLAGRVKGSAPYGWFGEHPTLRSHLTHTMQRLGGQGFTGAGLKDLEALEHYLTSMRAPARGAAAPEERIAEGRALFHDEKQGCGTCHAAGGSDGQRHDVGSGNPEEASVRFDTPSLHLAGGSGPFFHDGRFATLDDLLRKGDDKMGHVRHLDESQRASLVAYMTSLADPVPARAREPRTFLPARAELAPLGPIAETSFEEALLARSPERQVVETTSIDVDALPTIEIEAPISWDTKIAAPAGGTKGDDLIWKDGCAASSHAASWIAFDWFSTGMSSKLEQCLGAPSPNGYEHWTTTSLYTIDPAKDGKLRVGLHDGFIRIADREVRYTQSIVGDAVPIFDGLAYAMRVKCSDCKATERDRLFVVTTGTGFHMGGAFTIRKLSLEPGTAGHEVVTGLPNQLAEFSRATGAQLETGSTIGKPRGLVLRLDATRTSTEKSARVVFSRRSCSADSFECR
jgi:mono/diheme cytochrome c family protein